MRSRLSGWVVAMVLAGPFIPTAQAQGTSGKMQPDSGPAEVKWDCSRQIEKEFSFTASLMDRPAHPVKTGAAQDSGQPLANPLLAAPAMMEPVVLQPYVVTAKTIRLKPVAAPGGLLKSEDLGRLFSLGKNTDITTACEQTSTGHARVTLGLRYRW